MQKRYQRSVFWFRNDLRIHDHKALTTALLQSEELIPVYCLDPLQFEPTVWGFPKTGAFRAQFLLESLFILRQNLQAAGSNLIILQGNPVQCLLNLANKFRTEAVFFSEEMTDEEQKCEKRLRNQLKNHDFHSIPTATLIDKSNLPFSTRDLPMVFTDFKAQIEEQNVFPSPLPSPQRLPPLVAGIEIGNIPTLHQLKINPKPISEKSVLRFKGGEQEGLARLQHYLWDTDAISTYKETRNGLMGADYSAKFSPWLANGSLSARQVYAEIQKYEQERGANPSTYWLFYELLWRDYFRFLAEKVGNDLFKLDGIQHQKYVWKNDEKLLDALFHAQTGIPFIDANLRELLATGWMSNRGRQNVASFFARHLTLDWRIGAAFFESLLIDYDVCSNYGNWQYLSGVGNDPRNRLFNVIKQGKDYDPQGKFVKLWLPELKRIPPAFVHNPWDLPLRELNIASVKLGVTYPHRIATFKQPEKKEQKGKRGQKKARK